MGSWLVGVVAALIYGWVLGSAVYRARSWRQVALDWRSASYEWEAICQLWRTRAELLIEAAPDRQAALGLLWDHQELLELPEAEER